MLRRECPPWARRVRWPIPCTKLDFLQFGHEPAGLALLFESAACPLTGRYTALIQAFVYVQRHGHEKVEDFEGGSKRSGP
jgi:hypothetical protein